MLLYVCHVKTCHLPLSSPTRSGRGICQHCRSPLLVVVATSIAHVLCYLQRPPATAPPPPPGMPRRRRLATPAVHLRTHAQRQRFTCARMHSANGSLAHACTAPTVCKQRCDISPKASSRCPTVTPYHRGCHTCCS
jgi:hypothetical protein